MLLLPTAAVFLMQPVELEIIEKEQSFQENQIAVSNALRLARLHEVV